MAVWLNYYINPHFSEDSLEFPQGSLWLLAACFGQPHLERDKGQQEIAAVERECPAVHWTISH